MTVSGQGKGSTQYVAYSHTPIELKLWVEFRALVEAETNSAWAQQPAPVPTDLSAAFNNIVLGHVSKEEEVTNRSQSVLTYLEASSNPRPCPRWCPCNPMVVAQLQGHSMLVTVLLSHSLMCPLVPVVCRCQPWSAIS